jgi:hypothetical protein
LLRGKPAAACAGGVVGAPSPAQLCAEAFQVIGEDEIGVPVNDLGIQGMELGVLQLRHLQWSVRHACGNVPHYRAAFDAVGVFRRRDKAADQATPGQPESCQHIRPI